MLQESFLTGFKHLNSDQDVYQRLPFILVSRSYLKSFLLVLKRFAGKHRAHADTRFITVPEAFLRSILKNMSLIAKHCKSFELLTVVSEIYGDIAVMIPCTISAGSPDNSFKIMTNPVLLSQHLTKHTLEIGMHNVLLNATVASVLFRIGKSLHYFSKQAEIANIPGHTYKTLKHIGDYCLILRRIFQTNGPAIHVQCVDKITMDSIYHWLKEFNSVNMANMLILPLLELLTAIEGNWTMCSSFTRRLLDKSEFRLSDRSGMKMYDLTSKWILASVLDRGNASAQRIWCIHFLGEFGFEHSLAQAALISVFDDPHYEIRLAVSKVMAILTLNITQQSTGVIHTETECRLSSRGDFGKHSKNLMFLSFEYFMGQLSSFVETVKSDKPPINERETFGLWALHLSKHIFCTCRILTSQFTSSASQSHIIGIMAHISSVLHSGLTESRKSDSQPSLNSETRFVYAYVVTGFITGACISKFKTKNAKTPVVPLELISSFLPVLLTLRMDCQVMIRIKVLEICFSLLGLEGAHDLRHSAYNGKSVPNPDESDEQILQIVLKIVQPNLMINISHQLKLSQIKFIPIDDIDDNARVQHLSNNLLKRIYEHRLSAIIHESHIDADITKIRSDEVQKSHKTAALDQLNSKEVPFFDGVKREQMNIPDRLKVDQSQAFQIFERHLDRKINENERDDSFVERNVPNSRSKETGVSQKQTATADTTADIPEGKKLYISLNTINDSRTNVENQVLPKLDPTPISDAIVTNDICIEPASQLKNHLIEQGYDHAVSPDLHHDFLSEALASVDANLIASNPLTIPNDTSKFRSSNAFTANKPKLFQASNYSFPPDEGISSIVENNDDQMNLHELGHVNNSTSEHSAWSNPSLENALFATAGVDSKPLVNPHVELSSPPKTAIKSLQISSSLLDKSDASAVEASHLDVLVHNNLPLRSNVRSSTMKSVQFVIRHLYFSKTQFLEVDYFKLYSKGLLYGQLAAIELVIDRSTNTAEYLLQESLHPELRNVMQIDNSAFLELCQDIEINVTRAEESLSFVIAISAIHRYLLGVSRSIFALQKHISVVDVTQALIIVKDRIKLNAITRNILSTKTGVRSILLSTQNLMSVTESMANLHKLQDDGSLILFSPTNSLVEWLSAIEHLTTAK